MAPLYLVACVQAAPAPAGPLRGPGVQLGAGVHVASYPTELGTHLSGAKRGNAGGAGGPLGPHRLGARFAFTHWLDIGGDVSFRDVGGDLRVGQSRRLADVPWTVSVGGRTGALGPITEQELALRTRELRARLEVYPSFTTGRRTNWGGLFSSGISHGRRYGHIETNEFDNFASSGPEFLWDDTRLELAAGIRGEGKRMGFSAGIMPYISMFRSELVACEGCPDGQSVGLVNAYGFVVFVDGWLFWGVG